MSLSKSENFGYLRNPNLLRDRVKQPYTAEEIKEYKKCMDDPVYFITNYIKVITPGKGLTPFVPYECQKGLFDCLNNNRFTVLLASRQIGKSVSVTSFILWYLIFHPEKTVAILANKGAIAREMLSRLTLALENLPYFLQPGCKIVNKGSIEFSNLSRVIAAATSASSIRGMSCVPEYTKIVLQIKGKTIECTIKKALEEYKVNYNNFDPSIKILTHLGFKDFSGIKQMREENEFIRFIFTGGHFIECTKDHKLLLDNGEFKRADQIKIDDVLYPEKLVKRTLRKKYNISQPVYDAIKVQDTNSYYTSGVISHNCDLIFCDEFAFVENDEDFYTSTYPVISAGHDSKFIITSTPNGVGNVFHKIWSGAVTKTNDFIPYKITWRDIPGRDEEWKRQTIANTSVSQFNQEHECDFLGSSDTLVDPKRIMDMQAKNPIKQENGCNVYQDVEPNHKYVMTVDVSYGAEKDYSTFTITKITDLDGIFKTVAVYRSNRIPPLLFPDIIYKYAKLYNNAYVIIENNDQGAVVANALYYDIEYENIYVGSSINANSIGVRMTNKVKRIGCSNMKELIESKKFEIYDPNQISELMTFRAKGKSYEATSGNHDDLVMNLVLFSWFACTNMFEDLYDKNLKNFLYHDEISNIEDDITPVGIFYDVDKEDDNGFGPGWQTV